MSFQSLGTAQAGVEEPLEHPPAEQRFQVLERWGVLNPWNGAGAGKDPCATLSPLQLEQRHAYMLYT